MIFHDHVTMFDHVAEVKTLSVQSMIGWWCDYGGVSLVRSWWPNLDLCWSAQRRPRPPTHSATRHLAAAIRGFPQFFTLPTCGPYSIHTQNLKADINAVMVFVCVVIFPTVVHQLS